jgi:hypothetical protein
VYISGKVAEKTVITGMWNVVTLTTIQHENFGEINPFCFFENKEELTN